MDRYAFLRGMNLGGRRIKNEAERGISESGLDWKPIEAALGPGTIRTMGTVEQIAAKYC